MLAKAIEEVILSWAIFGAICLVLFGTTWLITMKPWRKQKHWSQWTMADELARRDAIEAKKKNKS